MPREEEPSAGIACSGTHNQQGDCAQDSHEGGSAARGPSPATPASGHDRRRGYAGVGRGAGDGTVRPCQAVECIAWGGLIDG